MKPEEFICKECQYRSVTPLGEAYCSHPSQSNTPTWDYCPACFRFKPLNN